MADPVPRVGDPARDLVVDARPPRRNPFFFHNTATTEIYTVYNTLSLHDALPICPHHLTLDLDDLVRLGPYGVCAPARSEEHTSELQSLYTISYAVFCLKKKK